MDARRPLVELCHLRTNRSHNAACTSSSSGSWGSTSTPAASIAGTLEAHIARGSASFGKALADQADEFAKALPRRADDIDELSNSVQVFGAPPRQRKALS